MTEAEIMGNTTPRIETLNEILDRYGTAKMLVVQHWPTRRNLDIVVSNTAVDKFIDRRDYLPVAGNVREYRYLTHWE